MTELGNKIRSLREQKSLTQSQLARALGVTPPAINHLENGTRKPSYSMLIKLCDVLEVSSNELTRMSTESEREVA